MEFRVEDLGLSGLGFILVQSSGPRLGQISGGFCAGVRFNFCPRQFIFTWALGFRVQCLGLKT